MKISIKKLLALPLSAFTMCTFNLTSAMESKRNPKESECGKLTLTACNHAALSDITFDIDSNFEQPVCWLCDDIIERNQIGCFIGCGEQIFKSTNPSEEYERIKNHMLHSTCANKLKWKHIPGKPFHLSVL